MSTLPQKFEYANVANNPVDKLWIPPDHTLVHVIELSKTVKCVIFRDKSVLTISFSSLTYQTLANFLYTGYQLIMYQNLEDIDKDDRICNCFSSSTNMKMNSFFKYWAKRFFDQAKDIIAKFIQENDFRERKSIILTGMSMGGAMAQCFFYYLEMFRVSVDYNNIEIHVKSFGSPRIGNQALKNWFNMFGNNVINYTICIQLDEKGMTCDPVCYFPSSDYGYVNNHNLKYMHNKREFDYSLIQNRGKNTCITFMNFFRELTFIKKDDLKLWVKIHQFDEYMKNL